MYCTHIMDATTTTISAIIAIYINKVNIMYTFRYNNLHEYNNIHPYT